MAGVTIVGPSGYLQRRTGNSPRGARARAMAWLVACVALAMGVPALAEPTPPLRAGIDGPVALGAGLAWLVPAVLLHPASMHSGPHLRPNDPLHLNFGIDRIAVGPRRGAIGRVSDVLVAGLLAGTVSDAAWSLRDREHQGRAAAITQSVLLTGAVVEWLKVAVGRERPYTYDSLEGIDDDFAHRSFPSGHTAMAMGSAMALTLAWRDSGFLQTTGGRWATAGVWTSAVATAGLRVASSNHFPTDVLTSTGIAVACALLVEGLRHAAR